MNKCKYPRGKIELHPRAILEKLNVNTFSLDNDMILELNEILSRFIPQKPTEYWGPDGNVFSSPRCPCCGSRVRPGKTKYSPVRDDRCRKCGQLIDWNYNV